MDYKKSYILLWVGILAGFIVILAGMALELKWLTAVGVALSAAAVLQTLCFFCCPACGGSWDTRGGIPHYCPHCGKFIR